MKHMNASEVQVNMFARHNQISKPRSRPALAASCLNPIALRDQLPQARKRDRGIRRKRGRVVRRKGLPVLPSISYLKMHEKWAISAFSIESQGREKQDRQRRIPYLLQEMRDRSVINAFLPHQESCSLSDVMLRAK
jgi:hypothetical protein